MRNRNLLKKHKEVPKIVRYILLHILGRFSSIMSVGDGLIGQIQPWLFLFFLFASVDNSPAGFLCSFFGQISI